MITYRFKITKANIFYFCSGLFFGLLLFVPSLFLIWGHHLFVGILLLVISLRLFFYKTIDAVLKKELILEGDRLLLKILFLNIKLDRTKCRLEIADVAYLRKNSAPDYALILVRDKKHLFP